MTAPSPRRGDLLIVAGEASGDLHAARMLSELRMLRPELRAFGLGGDELASAGFEAIAHSSEIAVVGLAEVLKILPRARRIFDGLLEETARREVAAAVLVDSPDFNLRLAKKLSRRGIPVVYYISPQVWAWRKGRIDAIERTVDRMLVLFPFEASFYAEHGVEAVHVGHPLVDEVPRLSSVWKERGLPPWVVALLPGSRNSEIRALLPTMLAAARRLREVSEDEVRFRLIQAPTVDPDLVETLLAESESESESEMELELEVVRSDRFSAIADSHLAVCASGTATLEVGLLGTPLVVVYRIHPVTYWLAQRLVDLPWFSMVNLVLGEGVVPELLQDRASPEGIADEVAGLLGDPGSIDRMRSRLGELRERLGPEGASRHAAREVARFLAESAGDPP